MPGNWKKQYFRYRDFFLNIVALYKRRRDLRAFLELILSLSTITIFVIFALKPTLLTIIDLYNQINNKKETLNVLNQKITNLQKANSVFEQYQEVVPQIDESVSTKAEPDTVSKQVLGVASKDNITLLSVSVGQVSIVGKGASSKTSSDVKPLPENAQQMTVSISFRGNYENLKVFIDDLEKMRMSVKVDSLTISSSQTQEGSTIVGTITARVPFIGQS